MREVGLDETKLAKTLRKLVLKRSRDRSSGAAGIAGDKLLLDLVKACAGLLETAKSDVREAFSSKPIVLHLAHNIPRPVRDGNQKK
jgi:hypothetical protein